MKKDFLRSLLVSAVMLGGFTSVQASDSSVEGMFNELCHGRSVMISKATFQGYLGSYPELGALLASGVAGEEDVARVLALADNLHIAPNFHENTLTFNLYSNGKFLARHVLHNETQADLENYRQIARQYLAPQVTLGGQALDSSIEGMFNELCHGGSVMISKATVQGYLSSYPEFRALLASEVADEEDVARVLALADNLHIAPNFHENTLTFTLYSNGTFLGRHVLNNETQADLENYRQIARQRLASAVVPQVQQVVTPVHAAPVRALSPVGPQVQQVVTPVQAAPVRVLSPVAPQVQQVARPVQVAPVRVLSALEQEIERLKALPTSRLNKQKITQLELQLQNQNSSK